MARYPHLKSSRSISKTIKDPYLAIHFRPMNENQPLVNITVILSLPPISERRLMFVILRNTSLEVPNHIQLFQKLFLIHRIVPCMMSTL
jgi:hypothetical protein